MEKSLDYYLVKASRVTCYLLTLGMIIFFISGYALVGRTDIISRNTAYDLHTTLDLPLFLVFIVHTLIQFKFAFRRWGFRNEFLANAILIAAGTILMAAALYLKFSPAFGFRWGWLPR